jgi:hypothetical protein
MILNLLRREEEGQSTYEKEHHRSRKIYSLRGAQLNPIII